MDLVERLHCEVDTAASLVTRKRVLFSGAKGDFMICKIVLFGYLLEIAAGIAG